MRADVTVRGAGIMGLACAFACAARGARVRVIDPGGVGAGASGGLVGALSPHAPDDAPGRWDEAKALQVRSLADGEAFWSEVRSAGGLDPGYGRTGRLMPLADAGAIAAARARAAAARSLWPQPFAWEVVEADPGAWGPASPSGRWARDSLAARVDPRRALAALAAAVRAKGGAVAAEGPEDGVVVEATGAAGFLARGLGGGVKGQAARLALAGVEACPQIYAGGLYVVPHADGTVAVGSTSEKAFADPGSTDALLDAVLARARVLVPALAGAPVLERWAGLRPRAADGGLVLGRREAGGPILANGGFRTGFGMAPLAARLVADLALEGRDRIPAPFRAERLAGGTRAP
jgi:glycine/D-amino acid oxidase-like deaminating enzyme